MSGQHLKDMVRGYRYRDDNKFRAAVEAVIEEEKAKKHTALAAELQRLIGHRDRNFSMAELPKDTDSRGDLLSLKETRHTLDDLVLTDETDATVRGFVAEAKRWDDLEAAGVTVRRRALLYGPPGCGKTSIAGAIAAELDRPFLVVRADTLLSSYLGKTGSNLAKVFEYAESGDYVILIDEFDSFGQSRSAKEDIGEMRRIVNALLQSIETYSGRSIVIAATNHHEILDTALWRRFDIVAEMPLPSVDEIADLLENQLGEEPRGDLAQKLVGMPHAAAAGLANAARRHAVLAGRASVNSEDVELALKEVEARRWT